MSGVISVSPKTSPLASLALNEESSSTEAKVLSVIPLLSVVKLVSAAKAALADITTKSNNNETNIAFSLIITPHFFNKLILK